jgi:hypothetical protein
MAEEAGGEDGGVVEDEGVVAREVGGEVEEMAVLPGLGCSIENEHARAVAGGGGLLRDEFRGEGIIEGGEVQRASVTGCGF